MNPRLRWALWSLGLGVAAWLAIFGHKTPSDELVVAVQERAPLAVESVPAETGSQPVAEPEELPAGQVMRLSSRSNLNEQALVGADLFGGDAGERANAAPPPPVQEIAPPPPERPFTLIGRMQEGGRWLAFLERDGINYVLGAGAEAAGFRIDAISKTEVRYTRQADKAQFVIPIDGEKRD